jgi:AAA ATPase domain/AAA domain, putative AbiEii toxin, Type IV TA system
MQFQSVQILNYKSFRDSDQISLNPGFNIIVGKNDSGKSAFLEALSLKSQSNPHRSQLTAPKPSSTLDPKSSIEFIVDISDQELSDILAPYKQIIIPCDPCEVTYEASIKCVDKFKNAVYDMSDAKGELICKWAANVSPQGYLKNGGKFEEGDTWIHLSINYLPNFLEFNFINGMTGPRNNIPSFAEICCAHFSNLIYTFRAERLNIGQCPVGTNRVLQPNAANLAEVLNLLISSNPKRYDKFLEHVRTIFPHITQVTAPIVSGNVAMVKIWSIPGESEREDLAVPLAESGTGVGQVLAMLYVVVTADVPKVIIIDEPQSFLHPGAVRKLIEILHTYPQHQYIITTHTPTAISATGAESLIQIRRDGYESIVDVISAKSTRDLKFFLADIGASLGDVFGADKVLWVEGPTEENCFPLILKKLSKTLLSGTQILAVKNTGDLEGKLASRIFDVYNKLTSSSTLLPPAIAFLLDTEGKSKSEKDEIDRKSSGLVQWLPRRMYENYLLSPSHLANILSEDDCEREETIGEQEIKEWLIAHSNDKKYFDKDKYDPNLKYPSDTWEKTVHAANLLNDLFNELTETRVEYRKVDHGLRLTELLIEEPTPAIQELSQFLKSILEENSDGNL